MVDRRTLFFLISSLLFASGLEEGSGLFNNNEAGGGRASSSSSSPSHLRKMETAIARELAWAEHAVEMYRRQEERVPVRSNFRGSHVHSKEWRDESKTLLQKQYEEVLNNAKE